jgi:hypothetical protein
MVTGWCQTVNGVKQLSYNNFISIKALVGYKFGGVEEMLFIATDFAL